MNEIIVGIDVGTTKVCTLVGRVEENDEITILGVGIVPSEGVKKGLIVDLGAATRAIRQSVDEAEQSSGLEINAALVSLAGASVTSTNSRGSTSVRNGVVNEYDMARALDQAQSIALPADREIIHVIQRGYMLDGQDGIRAPLGMHGSRLEVETHVVTAAAAMVSNLRQCVNDAGLEVVQFVLGPLASGEIILSESDREMGVAVCDIGGGTTDVALYVGGDVWHTMVMPVGGFHVTSDIAHGLRLPLDQAETLKVKYGHALQSAVSADDFVTIRPVGADMEEQISRQDLAFIIESRMTELFELILQDIKRSGYDGLLSAGMVLTGGGSQLPGVVELARRVLDMPVRQAQPANLTGMVDRLSDPAYSTSVGLLHWALVMSAQSLANEPSRRRGGRSIAAVLREWIKRLAP